jgi:hypothetical protein
LAGGVGEAGGVGGGGRVDRGLVGAPGAGGGLTCAFVHSGVGWIAALVSSEPAHASWRFPHATLRFASIRATQKYLQRSR